MTIRDWLTAEIDGELQSIPAQDEAEEPWLDSALGLALADSGLSDRSIELLMEVAGAPAATAESRSEIVAEIPPLAGRREALGISTAEAASQLGIGQSGYEALEQAPLRWLNLDASRAAGYIARLGIAPPVLVRWLATLLPEGPRFAWGYRPGAVLDRPVDATDTSRDRERLIAWGRALLAAETASEHGGDVRELLGHRWSPAVSEEHARQIAESAAARILQTDLRFDIEPSVLQVTLVALPTDRGAGYPAFQFDERGEAIPVVAEINELLDAVNDPWGVADWWLTEDPFLGARPVDIIGKGHGWDDRLRAAARALVESE